MVKFPGGAWLDLSEQEHSPFLGPGSREALEMSLPGTCGSSSLRNTETWCRGLHWQGRGRALDQELEA